MLNSFGDFYSFEDSKMDKSRVMARVGGVPAALKAIFYGDRGIVLPPNITKSGLFKFNNVE